MAHTATDQLLARIRAGDPVAIDLIIEQTVDRLRYYAHKRIRDFPAVRRLHETDDLLQEAMMRLRRALQAVKPEHAPDSFRRFLGLATEQMRRQLLDWNRHHYGPEGDGAHHASDPKAVDREGKITPQVEAAADPRSGPVSEVEWQEMHELVTKLPEDERQVFDLVYYQGMTQEEAAAVLGQSESTIKRRWRAARLRLHEWTKTNVSRPQDAGFKGAANRRNSP